MRWVCYQPCHARQRSNFCPQQVHATQNLPLKPTNHRALNPETATLPLASMHAMGGRRVRPRQVNFNERLSVVHLYDDDEDIDSSLKAFLEAQEEERMLMKALEAGSPRPHKGGRKQVRGGGKGGCRHCGHLHAEHIGDTVRGFYCWCCNSNLMAIRHYGAVRLIGSVFKTLFRAL